MKEENEDQNNIENENNENEIKENIDENNENEIKENLDDNNENEIKDNIDDNNEIINQKNDNDNIIQNDDIIEKNNDNENIILNDEIIPKNNDNDHIIQNEEIIPKNNDNDNIIQNEDIIPKNNDNDNIIQNDEIIPKNNDNDNIIQNEEIIPKNNDNDNIIINEKQNNNKIIQIENDNENNINIIQNKKKKQNNQNNQININNLNVINDNNGDKKKIIENFNKREQENERIVGLIKTKIKEIRRKYKFSLRFYKIMYNILKYFQDLAYEKIINTINEGTSYFSFLLNASELYSKLAEQVNASNNSITPTAKGPKMGNDILMDVVKKTQNLLYQNLLKISNDLKQNVISKGPLSKVQEKVIKIDTIRKNNLNKLKDIEETKTKVQKSYQKYEKIFELYVPSNKKDQNVQDNKNNNNNPQVRLPSLMDTPDLVYVTQTLMEVINRLILEINLYLADLKDSFCEINALFAQMNNLLSDSVLLYIGENKKIFNSDLTKHFDEIEKYYKKSENGKNEKMFELSIIFDTNENKQIIENQLQKYYELLNHSDKAKNELVMNKNNFSIDKYSNILLFFEWLISVSPQPTDLAVDDLINRTIKVKRDPGLFKGWKNSLFVFTKQNHLLLYDDAMTPETFLKIFELDKTSYRKKTENKKNYMFEIVANRKGKVMDFKGTYLFDGLSRQNVEEIPKLVYNAYFK